MEAKFSPRVKDVISYSREEALRLGHDYIGTEHLLLGLIREGDGMAIKILKQRRLGARRRVPTIPRQQLLLQRAIVHQRFTSRQSAGPSVTA